MGLRCVLVSSGQPSANPRLVKEAIALYEAGYTVTVLYCPISVWADQFDQILFGKYPGIKWVCVGHHPEKSKMLYLLSRVRQKLYQYLYRLWGNQFDAAIKSMVLFSQELKRQAQKESAYLYIGHNAGALPAIITAAKKHKAKAVFDFEDFHRGEDNEGSLHWQKLKIIEDSYVPFLNAATTASPQITNEYKKLYPNVPFKTINNCFPLAYAPGFKELDSKPMKLFWFSQFIGKNRGLETVIEAIALTGKNDISLSLLGNCTEELKLYFRDFAASKELTNDQLVFLPPVKEEDLTKVACMYHIGLACEVPHILNRELCLTNKLFIYLLSGNAILFSDTIAQTAFCKEHNEAGVLYGQGNVKACAELLLMYYNNESLLTKHRSRSYEYALSTDNWDQEKMNLLIYVSSLLEK